MYRSIARSSLMVALILDRVPDVPSEAARIDLLIGHRPPAGFNLDDTRVRLVLRLLLPREWSTERSRLQSATIGQRPTTRSPSVWPGRGTVGSPRL